MRHSSPQAPPSCLVPQNRRRSAHCAARAGRGGVGGEEGGEGGGGQGGDARRSGGQARARPAAEDAQDGHACCSSGAKRNSHARRRPDACVLAAHGVRAAVALPGVAATQHDVPSCSNRRCQRLAGVRQRCRLVRTALHPRRCCMWRVAAAQSGCAHKLSSASASIPWACVSATAAPEQTLEPAREWTRLYGRPLAELERPGQETIHSQRLVGCVASGAGTQ